MSCIAPPAKALRELALFSRVPSAHDDRGARPRGRDVQRAAGVLGDKSGIEYPVVARREAGQHRSHGAGAEHAGPDHQAALVPPVGEDSCDRPEDQPGQVLRGEREPGVAQRARDLEDVSGDGKVQQPRAERTDEAASPQQPEIPYLQGLEHDTARSPVYFIGIVNHR